MTGNRNRTEETEAVGSLPVGFAWLDPDGSADLPLPAYATSQAAGMDVAACIATPVTIAPGEIRLIGCGFAVAIPEGCELQVRPRSGLAVRHGVTVVNAPGTIDADYRGEVRVGLINLGREPFTVERGDRIAQLVLAPVVRAVLEVHASLAPTRAMRTLRCCAQRNSRRMSDARWMVTATSARLRSATGPRDARTSQAWRTGKNSSKTRGRGWPKTWTTS